MRVEIVLLGIIGLYRLFVVSVVELLSCIEGDGRRVEWVIFFYYKKTSIKLPKIQKKQVQIRMWSYDRNRHTHPRK